MWIKKNGANSIKETIERKTGKKYEEIDSCVFQPNIDNLDDAVTLAIDCINAGLPVYVFGDYDADGICSAAILTHCFRTFGIEPYIRLPKRISEGYGMSVVAVDEFADAGLVICVDNGIAAHEAILYAKNKGHCVIVLDHHMGDINNLPCADVIVDAHVFNSENEFDGYCGAGLAYRFADLLLSQTCGNFCGELRQTCTELAAIATIADIVPLQSENRYIVKTGLATMPYTNCKAIKALIDNLGVTEIDEKVVGFNIAPILNGAGRLYDDGAYLSYNLLMCEDEYQIYAQVENLVNINKQRKELVSSAYDIAVRHIEDFMLFTDKCLVLPMQIPEGICGLVASKVSEKYKKPCFVLAQVSDEVFKGSGRSYADINIKQALEEVKAKCPSCIASYGGHSGAAGIKVVDVINFKEQLEEVFNEIETNEEDDFFDLVISPNEIPFVYEELKKYKPFGEGCPAPVFKVENFNPVPSGSDFYSVMGDGSHIKFLGNGYKCVGFGLAPKFFSLGSPMCMNLYGKIGLSEFNGNKEINFQISDIEKNEVTKKTSLAAKIASRLQML